MTLMPINPAVEASAYRLDLISDDSDSFVMDDVAPITSVSTFTVAPFSRLFAVEAANADAYIYRWNSNSSSISATFYDSRARLLQADGTTPETFTRCVAVVFNKDGSKALVAQGDSVYNYTCSTAYGGTVTRTRVDSIIGGANTLTSLFTNDDGTVLYYTRTSSSTLYSRTLGTPFTTSSLGSEVAVKSFASGATIMGARAGTRLLVTTGTTVSEYECDAYDFANAVLLETATLTDAVVFANYSPNGRKLYTLRNDTIEQYSVEV